MSPIRTQSIKKLNRDVECIARKPITTESCRFIQAVGQGAITEFACTSATILAKLGMMAHVLGELRETLALRIVCMCVPFPILKTRSSWQCNNRADTVIATLGATMARITTNVRRAGEFEDCATLWDGARPLARQTPRFKPRISRSAVSPARYCACALPRLDTALHSASCDCDYGKRPTIVLLCAGC